MTTLIVKLSVFIILMIMICLMLYNSNKNVDDHHINNSEVFVPTSEWQVLKKDQAIPRGLHVELNLETGERRAKLLDQSDSNGQPSQLIVQKKEDDVETLVDVKKLESIDKIPQINLEKIGAIDPDKISEVKQKYRSYKELKEDFKELELSVKTDLEIMNDLMEKFKILKTSYTQSIAENEEWLNTLLDLEYLLHQVDNAQLFTKNNGIEDVVFPSLNSSSSKIKTEAARILGAACQNNVPSKISALESGAIRVLLHVFSSDPSSSVRSSALYGLSCIIRNFPVAQEKFINEGGIEVLNSAFVGKSTEDFKLQIKIVTLIDDLLFERKDIKDTIQSLSAENTIQANQQLKEAKEKLRQYDLVPLEGKLLELKWCQHLMNIFLNQIPVDDLNNVKDLDAHLLSHDNIEKIIRAMHTISSDCQAEFKNSDVLKTTLSSLVLLYKKLSDEEISDGDTDRYYTGLLTCIETFSQSIAS